MRGKNEKRNGRKMIKSTEIYLTFIIPGPREKEGTKGMIGRKKKNRNECAIQEIEKEKNEGKKN